MNPVAMLCWVLLATFALSTLALSGVVALAWHAGLKKRLSATADLIALRLLPPLGGALIVLTVVLPAFLSEEPHRQRETAGPLLLALAVLAVIMLGHAIWRAWQACVEAQALLRKCGPVKRRLVGAGQEIEVVDVAEPIVAVVGGWRPRFIAAECVVAACSGDELQQVIAHEAAHISARDNLKQLLLIASPDALAWTPLGSSLIERWRAGAELEADQRASGSDPRKRVALAAALIKVARAFGKDPPARRALSMPVAADDIEGRVLQLLAPPRPLPRRPSLATAIGLWLVLVLTAAAVLPVYHGVHESIEALVRIGL
ncbi:MAG: M48 family metalloprotease [Gammaproteobacteria bacterium]|nr:M48 family metalloprotease [Gammaproteobacteria bacterium]